MFRIKAARIIERLRSKNILAEQWVGRLAGNESWLNRIGTRAAARWACNAAAEIGKSVLAMVPESEFKRTLKEVYRRHVQRVT